MLKTAEWDASTPGERRSVKISRCLAILVSCLMLLICGIFFYLSNIVNLPDTSLLETDHDLSGSWKFSFDDKREFIYLGLDDSRWCEIGVPNGYLIPPGRQPGKCRNFSYQPEKMRGHTFWYRKEFNLNQPGELKEPSLFLGAVKNIAWVYLNGHYVGSTRLEDAPSVISIDKQFLRRGINLLSIKVEAGNENYPGLFHAYKRGIVLGEYRENVMERKALLQRVFLEPLITLVIQCLCLLFAIFLLFQEEDFFGRYVWLNIYFAGSALDSLSVLMYGSNNIPTGFRYLAEMVGIQFIVFGGAGFAVDLKILNPRYRRWLATMLGVLFSSSISVNLANIFFTSAMGPLIINLNKFYVGIAIAVMTSVAAAGFFRKSEALLVKIPSLLTLGALLVLATTFALDKLILSPVVIVHHPVLLSGVLSIVIIFLSVLEYAKKNRELSFFGRFIRPGLRLLLYSLGGYISKSKKVFRGRKIPVIKMDIADHTLLTYGMPYGMKRLFQDLWFSMIDQALSRLVFADKNVGDGSIYCVQEDASPQICTTTFAAVLDIRDNLVPLFWKTFQQKFTEISLGEPDLAEAAQKFMDQHRLRTGEQFWRWKLSVYYCIAYGFVDEGLWGLLHRSHYDVQGDLITLVSRLEDNTSPDEIVFESCFLAELQKENFSTTGLNISTRMVCLKGIGDVEISAISNRKMEDNFQIDDPDSRTNSSETDRPSLRASLKKR